MVGMEARMRVSSPITLSLRGTFRSQRTNTFLPFSASSLRSPTDCFFTAAMRMGVEPLVDAVKPGENGQRSYMSGVEFRRRHKSSTHASYARTWRNEQPAWGDSKLLVVGTEQPHTVDHYRSKERTRDLPGRGNGYSLTYRSYTCSDCQNTTFGHAPSQSTRMREHARFRSHDLSRQFFHSPDLITDGAMNAPTAWTHKAAHTTFIFLLW